MGKIKVRQTKGLITQTQKTRRVVRALGLGKIGRERVHKDNNCIRGMINKVNYLVRVEDESNV